VIRAVFSASEVNGGSLGPSFYDNHSHTLATTSSGPTQQFFFLLGQTTTHVLFRRRSLLATTTPQKEEPIHRIQKQAIELDRAQDKTGTTIANDLSKATQESQE